MNAPQEIRLPPHHTEAEQSVLGGLLLDNRAWDVIAGTITEADFYRDDHRRIFRHTVRLIDQGKPADVVTVFESIHRSNEVDQTGGIAYLGEIANATPSAANIHRYAEIVADRAMRRALLQAAWDTMAEAEAPGQESAGDRIDKALGRFMSLSELRAADGEPERIGGSLSGVVEELDRLAESGITPGLETGFDDLDRKTSGLQPGQMIIIAGRPSMGKTALALNIAEHVATTGGCALVFSMEMTRAELAKRSIASIGRVPMDHLRTAKLTEEEYDRIGGALSRLQESGLVVDETGGLTLAQMRARARRVKRKEGRLSLVVIDYVQLMEATRDGENRNAEITAISRGIKAMAKELQCPVIALSQLSRKVEERTSKRPMMSDLRESGALEQDADLILLMYRDEYYNRDTQWPGVAEIIIGKQRNGPTGDVRLAFHGEFCRFDNLTSFSDVSLQSMRSSNKRSRGFQE